MASLSSASEINQQEPFDGNGSETRWSDIDLYRLYSFGELKILLYDLCALLSISPSLIVISIGTLFACDTLEFFF